MSDQLPTIPQNNEEEEQDLIPVKLTPKLERWIELFMDKSNPKTYGNMTESAMQAYDCSNRVSAANIGSVNYRKVQSLALAYADDRGHTLGKMIDVAMAKMYDAKNGGGFIWWKELMVLFGHREKDGAKVVIQNNNQVNNIDLNAPEAVDFNKDFKKYLMQAK